MRRETEREIIDMDVFAVYSGIVLIACSILAYLYSGKAVHRPDVYRRFFLIYALVAVLAAIAVRLYQEERPDGLVLGAFLKEKRPSRKQLILRIALTVLMILPLYLFREKIGSLLYGAVLWKRSL